MKIISIANFKGGTGKTVTACNLAALLARDGSRVLLIDADPQHNATDFFLEDWGGTTLTDVLEGMGEDVWSDNTAPSGLDRLDLLPADMGLLRLDLASILYGSNEAKRRFDDFLSCVQSDGETDYVIVDCPPSFTAASVAALVASDEVLLPTRLDRFSKNGVQELIEQIRSTGYSCSGVRFRVLITMTDRSRLSRQGEEMLRVRGGLDVCRTVIRAGVAVGESSYARQPLYQYAPKSKVAEDYEALAREIRGEAAEDE